MPKEAKQEEETKEETLEKLKKINFVNMAKNLLDSSVTKADSYSKKKYTDQSLKQGKLVLGFLNAFLNSYKTKIQFYKLSGIKDKIKVIKGFK